MLGSIKLFVQIRNSILKVFLSLWLYLSLMNLGSLFYRSLHQRELPSRNKNLTKSIKNRCNLGQNVIRLGKRKINKETILIQSWRRITQYKRVGGRLRQISEHLRDTTVSSTALFRSNFLLPHRWVFSENIFPAKISDVNSCDLLSICDGSFAEP